MLAVEVDIEEKGPGIANYKNEFGRVKGEIAKSIMKNITHDQLIKRRDELGEMIKNIN